MRTIFVALLALLVGAAVVVADDSHEHAPAAAVDDARFEFMKQLEGRWVGDGLSEGMPEGAFEFRLTAGGTAIEEREMIGTPMEMLTVYHMEGKDLVGNHYCMLGNQPRVVAAKTVRDDTLSFTCDGKPGNARSHDEEHVHSWKMRLDGDKLFYSAELIKDGKLTEAPSVVLTRQSRTASN